jgi:hypothetical protein
MLFQRKIRKKAWWQHHQTNLSIRVRRSFSVQAKRSEKNPKKFSLRSKKMSFFRLFRFEAKHWKSQPKRKRAMRKK